MRQRHSLFLSPARWATLFSLLLAVFVLAGLAPKATEALALHQEARALRVEIERAQANIARLEKRKAYVQSDEYVELVARRELKLARPGEVVVVPAPAPQDFAPPTPPRDWGEGLREWWGQVTGGGSR